MAVSDTFKVGKEYTFNTLAPVHLGSSFKNLTLLAITNYEMASAITNVRDIQRIVYPTLPPGTSERYQDYVYLVFGKHGTNDKWVFATTWINPTSIQESSVLSVNVSIPNMDSTRVALLRDVLATNGFSGFNITTVVNP